MGTTSRGYPYPELSDAPNIPAWMRDQAQAINDDVNNLTAQTVVYKTGSFTVPASAAPLLMTWEAKEKDTQNNFSLGSSRLVAASSGRWLAAGLVTLTAIPPNGAESMYIWPRLNSAGSSVGGTALAQNRHCGINGQSGYSYIMDDFPMNAGEYIEFFVYQTRASGGITGVTGRYFTYMTLRKISS